MLKEIEEDRRLYLQRLKETKEKIKKEEQFQVEQWRKEIKDNFPEFKIVNLISYSYLDRKFHITNDVSFNIKKEDLKVDNSFSVFLKLCQFDDFTEEINRNVFKEDSSNEIRDL